MGTTMTLTTRNKRAIAVAKDVLKHLRAYKMPPKEFAYCEGPLRKLSPTDDAQKALPALRKQCVVCARGAMMLSHVGLFNNRAVADLGLGYGDNISTTSSTTTDILRDCFTEATLRTIEDAYESGRDGEGPYADIRSNRQRLAAIMKNVIRNKGRFISPKVRQK